MRKFSKSLLFLLFYFLFCGRLWPGKTGAWSQRYAAMELMTYVKSYAYIYDANDDSYFTIGGGLPADLQLKKWLSIETGLYYTPKGMVVRKTPPSNLQLNYFNIPLNLRFSVPVCNKVTIDYLVGFYFFSDFWILPSRSRK